MWTKSFIRVGLENFGIDFGMQMRIRMEIIKDTQHLLIPFPHVRHPLSRLYSVWRNKFTHYDYDEPDNYHDNNEMRRLFGRWWKKIRNWEAENPEFPENVIYNSTKLDNEYRAVLDRCAIMVKSLKTSILRFERGTYSIFDPKIVENIDFAVRKRYVLDF